MLLITQWSALKTPSHDNSGFTSMPLSGLRQQASQQWRQGSPQCRVLRENDFPDFSALCILVG